MDDLQVIELGKLQYMTTSNFPALHYTDLLMMESIYYIHLRIICTGGDIPPTSSPVGVDKHTGLVQQFVSVRPEIISLCLQQVGRQTGSPVTVKE